ncbi:XrtA/PEP-CTERM system TPR-repeat protein PrsT [Pelagibius sp.]|uniref:XrtA/PEP-CTERM system TPR-repeat protein PrsT n=1 Tax=Pelagibius sp. TaxID=1931238 RepID=UPI002627C379|nr:XrtA/PEP-CTERM system TPR-repeat protein PrsT [Pelagibius sp.]
MKIHAVSAIGKAACATMVERSARPPLMVLVASWLLAAALILGPMPAWSTSFLERAQQYYEEGDLASAAVELKNALQREPDNAEARFLLGKVLWQLNDVSAAEKELQRAEELGYGGEELNLLLAQTRLKLRRFQDVVSEVPDDIVIESDLQRDLYVARGEALLNLGQFDEALAIFDRVLQDGPHGAALANKARITVSLGDMAAAREMLDQALAADPDNPLVTTTDAAWSLRARQFESAKTSYTRSIKLDPTSPIPYVGLIEAHIGLGELDEAARIVRTLKSTQPDSILVVLQEAIVLFLQHDYRAAKVAADRVLAFYQTQPQAALIAGYSSYQLLEFEQARRNLAVYLTQRPQDDAARAVLGATLLKLGYTKEAYGLMAEPGEDIPDTTAYLGVLTSAAARMEDQSATLKYLKRLAASAPEDPEIQEDLGLSQIAAGEIEQGVETLNKALALNPRSEKAYSHLFGVHVQNRNYSSAILLTKQMQQSLPEQAAGFTLEAMALFAQGDVAGAEAALRLALEKEPDNPEAVGNLAQLLRAADRADEAVSVIEEALKQSPEDPALLLVYATLARSAGDEAKAQSLLRRILDNNPDAWQARALLARSLSETGDFAEAVAVGESALDANPNNPQLTKTVGLALLKSGEVSEALTLLDRLVSKTPTDARAHEYRSLALIQLGRTEEAWTAIEKAARLEPDNAAIKLAQANLLFLLGRLDESQELVSALKQDAPEDERLLVIEGKIALEEGRPEQAAAAFEAALAKDANSLIFLDLVHARFQAGQGERGLASMADWVAENPQDAVVRHRQAEYLMALGRWEEAAESYEAVLARQPNDARALNNLAWVKIELGDSQSALAAARRAADLVPQSISVSDTLAMALLHAGQELDAIELLKTITEDAPDDRTFRFHLAQALSAAGDISQAVIELERILSDPEAFREREDAEALLAALTR